MPNYLYKAVDENGKVVRGQMTAPTEFDMETRLRGEGKDLIDFKVKQEGGLLKRRVGTRDLITFCIHLEQLERAGVPVLDAIGDLRDSADSLAMKEILTQVYDDINGGEILSTALQKHPDVFNEIFCGLIAAGEKTGDLPEVMGQLAEHIRWQEAFRQKIKKAIRYPLVLLTVMGLAIGVMMVFVVPQLLDFLTSQGFDLPGYTLALIGLSNFFVAYWPFIFGVPVFGTIGLLLFYKSSAAFRYLLDKILLSTPFLGGIAIKIDMVRFSHFFAITFKGGISVLECLKISKKVIGNRIIQESVEDIITGVSDGYSITQSIQKTGKFPNLVVRMFRVGEDSGNMTNALENISYFYDREVNDSVERAVGTIQPTLTLVMGGMMFWVIAAVFGPLYQSFSNINI